ncbi:MAG: ATP-binding cassette domain-containing protein [Phycisphaeraceae bacterium]
MQHSVSVAVHATVEHQPATSLGAAEAAALFGLELDHHGPTALLPPMELTLASGQVTFLTGPSGSGKSTLLRAVRQALCEQAVELIDLAALPTWPDRPLAEGFPAPLPDDLDKTAGWLSRAGLAEAALLLRRPGELSEGQRFRLELAYALALAEVGEGFAVIVADEFAATLDRLTAKHVAMTVRRWMRRSSCALVVATTHDDLLEALTPDTLIELTAAGQVEVLTR